MKKEMTIIFPIDYFEMHSHVIKRNDSRNVFNNDVPFID